VMDSATPQNTAPSFCAYSPVPSPWDTSLPAFVSVTRTFFCGFQSPQHGTLPGYPHRVSRRPRGDASSPGGEQPDELFSRQADEIVRPAQADLGDRVEGDAPEDVWAGVEEGRRELHGAALAGVPPAPKPQRRKKSRASSSKLKTDVHPEGRR
jgi:hypothetical protein